MQQVTQRVASHAPNQRPWSVQLASTPAQQQPRDERDRGEDDEQGQHTRHIRRIHASRGRDGRDTPERADNSAAVLDQ